MELNKEILKFIYESKTEDAILLLESCLDYTVSSRSEQEIISVNLKDKGNTIKAVKEIIASQGLESKDSINKINLDIKNLLSKKKVSHVGNTSDKPVPEPVNPNTNTKSIETVKKLNPFDDIENNPYLIRIEKECLLSVFDAAYKTTTIGDLPDKAKRHYFRLASAKLRILKTLTGSI